MALRKREQSSSAKKVKRKNKRKRKLRKENLANLRKNLVPTKEDADPHQLNLKIALLNQNQDLFQDLYLYQIQDQFLYL